MSEPEPVPPARSTPNNPGGRPGAGADAGRVRKSLRRGRWWPRFLHGLRTSVGGNAQAFGYSITITVTFGVVTSAEGQPSQPELMGFAVSAVAAFSLLNVIVARMLARTESTAELSKIILIATATDFLAVGAGVGAAMGIAHAAGGWAAWVFAPFGAGLVYVLVQSLELSLGEVRAADDDDG